MGPARRRGVGAAAVEPDASVRAGVDQRVGPAPPRPVVPARHRRQPRSSSTSPTTSRTATTAPRQPLDASWTRSLAAAGPAPGRTISEIRDTLRGCRPGVDHRRRRVDASCARHPHRFQADGGDPARWWLGRRSRRPPPIPRRAAAGPHPTRAVPLAARSARRVAAAGRPWRRRGGHRHRQDHGRRGRRRRRARPRRAGPGARADHASSPSSGPGSWPATGRRRRSVGRLGGGHRDDLGHHDIVVAVVNSARDADLRPRRPGGLLVADECHRYGTDANRVALARPVPPPARALRHLRPRRRRPPRLARPVLRRDLLPASATSAPSATASSPPSSSRCAASS